MATRGHRTPTSEGAAPRVMRAAIVDAYRRVDSGRKRGNVIVHPWPAPAVLSHAPLSSTSLRPKTRTGERSRS
jgi:hypothetical protein